MATFTSINKAFTKMSKDVEKAAKRAASRASVSTRAKFRKDAAKELGVTSARVNKRARLLKISKQSVTAGIEIGTKIKMPAHYFKPGRVKTESAKGPRYTATYQIKGQGRVTIKGAFLGTVNSNKDTNKLVFTRKGAARFPLDVVRVDAFLSVVQKAQPALGGHLSSTFKKNFVSELNFLKSKTEK